MKTHWKKAFKSDYLSASDVESTDLNLVVKEVKFVECVTQSGKKFCNVAYFADGKTKPMILNVTNSKILKSFAGNSRFIEDWNNIPIRVYVDPSVRFGSEVTEGLRIRAVQPKVTKPELVPGNETWINAIKYLKGAGTIDGIKAKYSLSEQNEELLKSESL